MNLWKLTHHQGKYALELLPLGKRIREVDRYLSSDETLWLLHTGLAGSRGAALWRWFFNWSSTVAWCKDREQLKVLAQESFHRKNVNLSPLLTTYSADRSLARLRLVKADSSVCVLPHEFDNAMSLVAMWSLLQEWEIVFPDRTDLTLDEVSEQLRWRWLFAWPDAEFYEALNRIKEQGLLSLDRKLKPAVVSPRVTRTELLSRLF